ncbi:MAG TPA: adenylate/guanylate cyclase domain-containing protein [Burkholderiales bacterium]
MNVQPVIDWLDGGATPASTPQDVLAELCKRLLEQGLDLYRVAVFVRTLHPNVLGRGFIWLRGREDIEVVEAAHGFRDTPLYQQSPMRIVFEQHVEVRRVLAPGAELDFPVLEDFRKEGGTEFVSLPLRFTSGEVHAASFVTRQPGGFSEADMAALRRILPPFTRIAEIYAMRRTAQNILDAYLGRQAGEKVLAGHIRRGDGEEIHAVIWFCDLRDSTRLADAMSRDAFLRLLNEFFECVLEPVLAAGGEVLRFVGDAALAIFPVGGDAGDACRRAVEAARTAIARVEALNARREQALRFGIGLHLGHVLYGNIGTPGRIEFTVIGAAANEAARIESLCKTLGVPLLLSAPVASHVQDCHSLGLHSLRGVGEPMELFTLARSGVQSARPPHGNSEPGAGGRST